MQKTIIKSLKSSGKILMGSFGKVKNISVKEDQSNIVTETDLASEKNIVSIIESKFPDHGIIAEETGFKNKNSEYLWIIDPIDGTSNFAAGIPWFGIFIAVLKNFKPIMAGTYIPFYDALYFAELGKGAYSNGKKISVSNATDLKNILFSCPLDFSEDKLKTDFGVKIIRELVPRIRNLRATNCVIDPCYTADGKLGGFIWQTSKVWDVAAPELIIKEAGGLVTDIDGKPLDLKADESNYKRNFTVVASNRILHPEVLKLIKAAKTRQIL